MSRMGEGASTARWLADAGADRRRVYDAKMRERGFRRVSILVPLDYVEWIKTFGSLLRNAEPDDLAHYRDELESYLADCYAAYDQDLASGVYCDTEPSDRD